MGRGEGGAEGREIPEAEWSDALAEFSRKHRRARVTVEIQDAGGELRALAPEARFELDLLELRPVSQGRGMDVRLVVHRHPGARIETAELPRATRIVQRDASLAIEGEGGSGMRIQAIASEPASS